MPSGKFTDFLNALRGFESGVNPDTIASGYALEAGYVTQENFALYEAGALTLEGLQYTSRNFLGFTGYQLGEPLLIDLGYYRDDKYYNNGETYNYFDGTFTGKDGVVNFAALQTSLQESIMLGAFGLNLKYIDAGLAPKGKTLADFIGTTRTYQTSSGESVTVTYTMTGILAAAHLRGATGVVELLLNDSPSADETGTSILQYVTQFGGYDSLSAATLKSAQTRGTTLDLAERLWGRDFDHDGDVNGVATVSDDTLIGGTGRDPMRGGAGDDIYIVNAAGQRVEEISGEGTDAVFSSVSFSLARQDIENLTLMGSSAINATGNGLANVLTGNAGANRLDGSAGADTMAGGAGSDTYVVDDLGDRVLETAAAGVDTVLSSVTFSLARQHVENLTLTGTAAIDGAGNTLANVIKGNAAANRLDGSTGADTLMGGAGDDLYIVDDAGDRVIEASGAGLDTVNASVSFSLAGQHVENLNLVGRAAIDGTGNGLANRIVGRDGANVIDGMLGADRLTGGAGADTFVFSTALAPENVDVITDFSHAADTIQLSRTVFAGLGARFGADQFWSGAGVTAAHDGSDRIIYDTTSGALLFDRDGTGTTYAAVRFATLTGGPDDVDATDFRVV